MFPDPTVFFNQKKKESPEIIPLTSLVSLGQLAAVRELKQKLNDRLTVNNQDASGNLPATIAAERNDLPMLKLLVEYGADLELLDGRGRNALGWARKNQDNEMITFILNSIEKKDKNQIRC